MRRTPGIFLAGAGRDPWGVLVSEIMLQQTPVSRVLPVWDAWMTRWATPAALAAEPSGEAVRAWGRLGYPRRALRLHESARAITERHNGEVPSSHTDLLALPGIGAYTAAAVASFAFRQRHAVLDTNVRRVLARLMSGAEYPPKSQTRAEVELAESLLPPDPPTAARWAVAVMELGALVCTARTPAASTARCSTSAPGNSPDAPPTTARRAGAKPTRAPTASAEAASWPSYATPRAQSRNRPSTSSGQTPSNANAP